MLTTYLGRVGGSVPSIVAALSFVGGGVGNALVFLFCGAEDSPSLGASDSLVGLTFWARGRRHPSTKFENLGSNRFQTHKINQIAYAGATYVPINEYTDSILSQGVGWGKVSRSSETVSVRTACANSSGCFALHTSTALMYFSRVDIYWVATSFA